MDHKNKNRSTFFIQVRSNTQKKCRLVLDFTHLKMIALACIRSPSLPVLGHLVTGVKTTELLFSMRDSHIMYFSYVQWYSVRLCKQTAHILRTAAVAMREKLVPDSTDNTDKDNRYRRVITQIEKRNC